MAEDIDRDSKTAIDCFLGIGGDDKAPNSVAGEDDSEKINNNDSAAAPRLFVWISRNKGERKLYASTDSFDNHNYGALVFINTSSSTSRPIQHVNQIQCMTLSPLRLQDEEGAKAGFRDGDESSTATSTTEEQSDSDTDNVSSDTFLTLQLFTRHCFTPTIQAMATEKANSGASSSNDASDTNAQSTSGMKATGTGDTKLLSNLQSKIRELDLTLSQCRQSSLHAIPHITLQTHPVLQSASVSSTSKISLEELNLSHYLTNDTFLNEVQSKVNTWIVQIRKVTTLPSTHTFNQSDTDLDEVAYWANLHSALAHIRDELSKPSTVLTLTLLKSAKRFVTTIALENNTGLDSAQSIVNDVHHFLKAYPAQKLASAGDWDQITSSLEGIFDHLPKVRQSRYYDFKVVNLLEASTATLKDRMDYTLRNQFKSNGVVMVDYETYEKHVYGPSQDIFVLFEDLYGRFVEFVLEFGRKRGIGANNSNRGDKTPAQIVESVVLHHLPLRERLDAIHIFRSQHEKLRLVVTEVLMGEENNDQTVVDDPSSLTNEMSGDNNIFSAAGAIREVEDAPVTVFASIDVLDLSEKGNVAFQAALERYERKIDAIEERLAKLLRAKLTSCQVRICTLQLTCIGHS